MQASIKTKYVFYIPGLLALLLFVACGVGEYWNIVVVADPEEIARYNFGTEAMLAYGGDKYRSSSAYAAASLVTGLLALIGLIASLSILARSKIKPLLKAYVCSGITLAVIIAVGYAW